MNPAARHDDAHDDDVPNDDPFPIDFSGAADVSDADDDEPAWDAGDERRRRDPMAPPAEPCECYCLHCQRTFMSDRIWFQRIVNYRGSLDGFWMCPTPNCDGAGFTFDIHPTDPDHPANANWDFGDDDEDDEDQDEEGFDDDDCDPDEDDDFDADDFNNPFADDEHDGEYDPDEPQYKALDGYFGGDDFDNDIEGEEWKYGLEPGQGLRERAWVEHDVALWEAEHERYDEPDERPRELDWSDRNEGDDRISDEDIPF